MASSTDQVQQIIDIFRDPCSDGEAQKLAQELLASRAALSEVRNFCEATTNSNAPWQWSTVRSNYAKSVTDIIDRNLSTS